MTPAAGVPVEPDREAGRRWIVDELADPVYAAAEPSALERVLGWFWDRLSSVELPSGPGGELLLLLAVVAGAAVLAVALRFAGPLRARGRTGARDPVFGDRATSATEHRALAETAASAGRWTEAVRERFRAVVRSMEERVVLDPRPGRTAHEAAAEAARSLPAAAGALMAAAGVFEDVVYGDRPATAESYRQVAELDEAVARSRPLAGTRPAEPSPQAAGP